MSALDLSHMGPSDAVAALRSYPRRFRELFAKVDDDELPAEAVEHADHVARSVALLGEGLRQVLVQDQPVLMPAIASDAEREWAQATTSSVDDVLAFVDMECNALADTIADVQSSAWTRTATVAGSGATMNALDVVREAVRTGADHLRAAETAISRQ